MSEVKKYCTIKDKQIDLTTIVNLFAYFFNGKGCNMALDNYIKYDLAVQLKSAINPDYNKDETKFGILRYSESTKTYYSDDNLAKQHVKQITKEDIQQAETKQSLDECMNELQMKLGIENKRSKWRCQFKSSRS